MNTSKSKKLSFMEKFSYGLGDCSANVVVALTGTFLSAYYTDTVGIAAAAVGTMLLLCRILDGGSDLLMGALVDKTSSKYGKARPWMLWTAPLMAIGIYRYRKLIKSYKSIFMFPCSFIASAFTVFCY